MNIFGNLKKEYDICIVGAGVLGSYLASLLVNSNKSILLLDAGPNDTPVLGRNFIKEITFPDLPYSGALLGRYFGLGGTGVAWGGSLVQYSNMDSYSSCKSEWSYIDSLYDNYAAEVLNNLSIPDNLKSEYFSGIYNKNSYISDGILCNFTRIKSLNMPFYNRNFFEKYRRVFEKSENLQILSNSALINYSVLEGGKKKLILRNVLEANSVVETSCKFLVIASGAIESSILVSSYYDNTNTKLNNLSDHISIPLFSFSGSLKSQIIKDFSPSIYNSWLLTNRLIFSNVKKINFPHFLHFTFNDQSSSFFHFKKLLAAFQSRNFQLNSILNFFAAFSYFLRLLISYTLRKKVYFSPDSDVTLRFDFESSDPEINSVGISHNSNRFVNWSITDSDLERVNLVQDTLYSLFIKNGVSEKDIKLIKHSLSSIRSSDNAYDAYHPCGMLSKYCSEAKVIGQHNVFALSTASLPSAGNANPTFTSLCEAHSVAKLILNND